MYLERYMTVLVAYMSKTGNTKKVAEAIYDEIPQPKEIKRIEDVTSLEDYDLAFLGFPTHAFGPDKKVKTFLQTHVKDRTIALFITHMAPEDAPPLPEWIQKFKDAAVGANIIGVFNCQGQLNSRLMKTIVRIRYPFQANSSQGQPDETRLERAKIFANEVINKFKP
jgi:flavodoxin